MGVGGALCAPLPPGERSDKNDPTQIGLNKSKPDKSDTSVNLYLKDNNSLPPEVYLGRHQIFMMGALCKK